MFTIAGGILLAVFLIVVCGAILAVFITPIQLFFEHLRFVKHKRLPVRHLDLGSDGREGSV